MNADYDFPCPTCPESGMQALPVSLLFTEDLMFYCHLCQCYYQRISKEKVEKFLQRTVPQTEWGDG